MGRRRKRSDTGDQQEGVGAMTGTLWFFGWIAYIGLGLLGAGLLNQLQARYARRWLASLTVIGSLALFIMTASLTRSQNGVLVLPHPWPQFVFSAVPLAPLWSVVAGLLFLSAVFITHSSSRQRQILYALVPLIGAVGIFLWSGSGLLLLIAWELISVISYLGLVTTRRARPVWNAGWVLLALSELGGMLLLIALVWLTPPAHGLSGFHDGFARLTGHPETVPHATIIMILALIAFGVKAGLFPVMIWMPMAEPEAPGVVAGLFSGLLTALAISGLLAMDRIVRPGIAWGVWLLVLGVLGALSAALYSLVSRHVKRILAYSTLEILGLVFVALGIWEISIRVDPHNIVSTMAMDSAIVLLVAHAGSKFVLFSVTDFAGRWGHTLDRMGGLLRYAPKTGGLALLATLTLGGIPPLGGFLGEWLLLESLFKPLTGSFDPKAIHFALIIAGSLVALTVALGVTAYLRWFGFIFLGPLHQKPATSPEEPRKTFRTGLWLPLLLPVVAGPAAPWFIPWINSRLVFFLSQSKQVIAPTLIHPAVAQPLVRIGANLVPAPGASGTVIFPQGFSVDDPYVLSWMIGLLTLVLIGIRAMIRAKHPLRKVSPWTGGDTAYKPRTSYSAEGFVHPLRLAFAKFYGLKRQRYDHPGARFYRHTVIYRLESQVYRPLMTMAANIGQYVRRTQSGSVTQYVAYVWGTLLILIVLIFAKR